MNIGLNGKTALVTGSTAGIGLAIATGLAKAGAQVTIVGRDQAGVDEAIKQLQQADGVNDADNIKGIVADAGTAGGCQTIINTLPEVDILVNNLGIYGATPFFDIDDNAWEEMFQINVMSGVRLSRHYAKAMKEKGWPTRRRERHIIRRRSPPPAHPLPSSLRCWPHSLPCRPEPF